MRGSSSDRRSLHETPRTKKKKRHALHITLTNRRRGPGGGRRASPEGNRADVSGAAAARGGGRGKGGKSRARRDVLPSSHEPRSRREDDQDGSAGDGTGLHLRGGAVGGAGASGVQVGAGVAARAAVDPHVHGPHHRRREAAPLHSQNWVCPRTSQRWICSTWFQSKMV